MAHHPRKNTRTGEELGRRNIRNKFVEGVGGGSEIKVCAGCKGEALFFFAKNPNLTIL